VWRVRAHVRISPDLSNLGIKKLGERNKLMAKIAKIKAAGRVAASAASETSSTGSDDEGQTVKISATLKKKAVEITVSQTISLNVLIDKLSNEFGQRVKVSVCVHVFACEIVSCLIVLTSSL
jgi:hypothetical protein